MTLLSDSAGSATPAGGDAPIWSGRWVSDRWPIELHSGLSPVGLRPRDLLGIALRHNARRSQLLVSTVLGKHVPADPRVVLSTGHSLGSLVAERLGSPARGVVVIGYAETATGLGHAVADALPGCTYLHSTRRAVPGVAAAAGFEEEHSHATGHLLLPEDSGLLAAPGPMVLVDDELSTGRTVRNTIRALPGRERYVVATLVDLRSAEDQVELDRLAGELGCPIEVVALATGAVALPPAAPPVPPEPHPVLGARPEVVVLSDCWPRGLRDGARHGWRPADSDVLDRRLPTLAEAVTAALSGPRVLVLGTEELLYVPVRLAAAVAELTTAEISSSSTTRSPAHVVDDPGYPLRTRIAFGSPADGGPRFAYNVAPGLDPARRFDTVVLVTDEDPAPVVQALDGCCDRVVVVPVPAYRPAPLPAPLRGPAFGSYAAPEVGWLLQDLSSVTLEAPTEEREEVIQAGRGHYAESLPIEYEPSMAYRALYDKALAAAAGRVAVALGVVTERVLRRRARPVLVSLARAGTPIGVLMRRWAQRRHGLDVPHYALSIVRGRGVDTVALRWLAAHHDPADVVFVDGWTGKGAIVRELTAALDEHAGATGHRFDPELAVLADPGHCVRTYGTRDDFLIPSACLNSTVSGLVSRTVLNDELIAPGEFHGAKFYSDLAAADVSVAFLDAITARFDGVGELPVLPGLDAAPPSWAGWAAIERISAAYGIGEVNLVKPGVGETTRVLLRRVPWKILARTGSEADIEHVLLLAAERGVPVEPVQDLPYSCVGLIQPGFRRS